MNYKEEFKNLKRNYDHLREFSADQIVELEDKLQRLTAELDKAQREQGKCISCENSVGTVEQIYKELADERDAALLEAKGLREELEALKQK